MTALVSANRGLVYFVAKKFSKVAPLEDLLQEGTIGLLRAAKSFDVSKGKWGPYAYGWIRAYVKRFTEKQNIVLKLRRGGGVYEHVRSLSLDAPRGHDRDDTWLDSLMGSECGADEQLEQQQFRQQVRGVLERLGLDNLGRAIVEQRLMAASPAPLREIGAQFGVSGEHVRQIELKVRAKLARHLAPIHEEASC